MLLFTILLIISFSGCKKNIDQQIENDITTTLNTIISGNQSGEVYVYSVDTFEQIIADDDIAEKMANKISYKISKTTLTENNATAEVVFTTPDMYTIITDTSKNTDNVDDLIENVSDKLDGNYPEKDFNVLLDLKLVNEHWYIVPNDELSNALSGGLITYYSELGMNTVDTLTEEESDNDNEKE